MDQCQCKRAIVTARPAGKVLTSDTFPLNPSFSYDNMKPLNDSDSIFTAVEQLDDNASMPIKLSDPMLTTVVAILVVDFGISPRTPFCLASFAPRLWRLKSIKLSFTISSSGATNNNEGGMHGSTFVSFVLYRGLDLLVLRHPTVERSMAPRPILRTERLEGSLQN